ncbi:MAG: B12-binding domain-containing radical SAM protein, partial [Clostridiales bacterium]|nr:B12-binding domain-containing radical SAM protein [Clostridiales bacterium]
MNEPVGTIAARITEKSPTVIGLCCYIWNITYIKKLLPSLKKALPDAVIILGGPEVSYNAADILQELPYVDYVLSGEGELPFSRLLDALSSGTDIGAVPGVCRRTGERIIAAPPYCSSDDPPNPYTDAYVKALNGRIAYLETSRGCPFSCAFCLSGRKQPDSRASESVRFFDMARAKRDLLLLSVSGTKTVK